MRLRNYDAEPIVFNEEVISAHNFLLVMQQRSIDIQWFIQVILTQ